ncbi:MAG: hypothetical protein LBH21_02240, partial [Gracilibacteraceae bacterium]|nr:hypothetical protein [Gracilibacteraceae bacterium]
MLTSRLFAPEQKEKPFGSHAEYADYLFACVDVRLEAYIAGMKPLLLNEGGGYRNVLYPDIETAHDLCQKRLTDFSATLAACSPPASGPAGAGPDAETEDLFAALAGEGAPGTPPGTPPIGEMLAYVESRAQVTDHAAVPLPIHTLSRKLGLTPFSLFCFAAALLSATQTNYAVIFQIVGQNASLTAPSLESAARVYRGPEFSLTAAAGDMSLALEQLAPLLDMNVNKTMPFSTVLSPDKRMLDFLFGASPLRLDEKYNRFFSLLTDGEELDPLLAGESQLDALRIAFAGGTRVFSLYGDEGSGRRFTIRHFCAERRLNCVGLDCGKLFAYDFAFVEKALWALARECVLTDACCCLAHLGYREEEKEKFFGYMDLALSKLTENKLTVFTSSQEKLPLKEITRLDFAQFELPAPSGLEREELWRYYARPYEFESDVDLVEMAAKFLFTPGKIKNALKMGRSLA